MAAALVARALHLFDPEQWIDARTAAPWVFTLAIVCAAALPVLLRTAFAHRMRREKSVPEALFFRFQRRLILAALMTPYLGTIVCLADFPRFYLAGVVLAIFYAIYYHYPSQRRIAFDRRIFRVG